MKRRSTHLVQRPLSLGAGAQPGMTVMIDEDPAPSQGRERHELGIGANPQ